MECADRVQGQLIVSLSGIRTDVLTDAVELAAQLDGRGIPLSLLVAPRLRGGYRLMQDAATLEWLRRRRDQGDALVLHGYDQAATKRRRAEFAELPEHEAVLRLTAADRVLEAAGLRTRLFAPPRWALSPGALAALPRIGFGLCADRTAVRDLRSGTALRSRVLEVRGTSRTEPWRCRALVMAAARTARRGGLVRVSIDAKDLARSGPRQAVLDALDLAVHHGAVPSCYHLPVARQQAA